MPQKKFMVTLFSTIVLVYGKVNFTNLGRYSLFNEKTYRRQFFKNFDLTQFSKYFLKKALNHQRTIIAIIDCSFLKKSGKKTEGKGYFYNGVAGRAEQGLEIYVISIVEVKTHISHSLSVQQALSRPTTELPKKPRTVPRKKTQKNAVKNRCLKAQCLK